jgi:PBSX family phage terminase large subunit
MGSLRTSEAVFLGTTNPDTPMNFVKTDYLDRGSELGLQSIKFDMDDNPALTREYIEQVNREYVGVFHDRFIKGLWVLAEGLIYDMWRDDYLFDDGETPTDGDMYVAIDYGTTNPATFLKILDDGQKIWILDEYYWSSKEKNRQKEDSEYADDFKAFVGDDPVIRAIIDPSAASFKRSLLNRGFNVKEAENDVVEGIRRVSTMMAHGNIRIHKKCKNLRNELMAYIWDEKAAERGEEKPLKQSDHCMDALRYFVYTMVHKWRVSAN